MKSQKDFIESLLSNKDRKRLWVLPAITKNEIDIQAEKVITWLHPSGHIGYVIYNNGEKISAFMLDKLTEKSSSNKACMCSWCLSIKPMWQMSLFSKKLSENKSHSVILCSDLNCLYSIGNPGMHAMRESLTIDEKTARYYKNLEDYIAAFIG